jgi:hypothetical protein
MYRSDYSKTKSINRKGRKEITQRTQRAHYLSFNFAHFAFALCALRLNELNFKKPV